MREGAGAREEDPRWLVLSQEAGTLGQGGRPRNRSGKVCKGQDPLPGDRIILECLEVLLSSPNNSDQLETKW